MGANPKNISTWRPTIEKIKKKVNGWKANLLSKAGRLVMIKFVINSLLLYFLGLFKMPSQVTKNIISLHSRFFWSKKNGGKGIPLVKLSQIQLPKELGGLGLGDLGVKNTTKLFKWWW